MSRKLGKDKNWGSRSGRRVKEKAPNSLAAILSRQGISDDVLERISTGDADLQTVASDLLNVRRARHADLKAPKKVLKTSHGTLYKGDCLAVLGNLPDDSLDCIFADPPFNLSKEYENGTHDRMSDSEYLEWTYTWLDACATKLKPGGAFYVYNIPKWASFISAYLSNRLNFRHWIAVDITFSMPIPNKLYPSHYALLYFIKGERPRHFTPPRLPMETCPRCGKELHDYGGYKMKMNPEGLSLRDVWVDIPPVRHSKYKNRDANELSLKLLDRILDVSTAEGDLVFDPFGGSGTTYAAAEIKKRKWVGVELGDCAPIVERLKDLEIDKTTLQRYRKALNQLFSDEALIARVKNGLPVNNYRVSEDQIQRIMKRVPHSCAQNSIPAV